MNYPYELEWIGGGMRDHTARVLAGRPLYVAPGAGWFPYEYPPLYFYVSALVVRLTGSSIYCGMRIVSILSTLGCAALIVIWTRQLIGSQHQTSPAVIREPGLPNHDGDTKPPLLWPLLAAGLFLSAYRLTGAWYDVERLDMLFLFLSLLGIVWLDAGPRWSVPSAIAFALAFFTKQQAVLFIFGGIGALAYRREWRGLRMFAVVCLVACLVPATLLNARTHGWFAYYCFHIPLANGIQGQLARQFVLGDLPLYAPMIALVAICLARGTRVGTAPARAASCDAVLIGMTLMGLLGSLLSRAHWGGDQNVLIAGYLFLGIAGCVTAGRYEREHPVAAAPLYCLVLAQLLTGVYRPDAQLPSAANRAAGLRHLEAVRQLEREGEVLCLDHGGQTAQAHFQTMALLDVVNADKRLPEPLTTALKAHRYSAILTDVIPSPSSVLGQVLDTTYAPTERLNLNATWTVTGYPTPGPTRPVWIMRPHKP
jgi:hypothetical protein